MTGEHPHPAHLREPRRHLRKVFAHLSSGRPLVEPGVHTVGLDPIPTERKRVHAVIGGRGVQANERIRILPMTSRSQAAVEHGHLHIRLSHQCIDERQGARARSYDQIIRAHQHVPLLPVPELKSTVVLFCRERIARSFFYAPFDGGSRPTSRPRASEPARRSSTKPRAWRRSTASRASRSGTSRSRPA